MERRSLCPLSVGAPPYENCACANANEGGVCPIELSPLNPEVRTQTIPAIPVPKEIKKEIAQKGSVKGRGF